MAVSVLIICLFLSLTGCGHAEDTYFSSPDSASFTYLVSVAAKETGGSGILYQADESCLYVLTAGHVLSGLEAGEEAVICFFDGWEVSCGNICFSETSDLAMVRIPAEKIPEEHRVLYQCAEWDKESFDRLQSGDGCTAAGFTKEKECVQYEGNILDAWIYMEDYGQYMIWANVGIQPGMSGGGLLDDKGQLVGILSGGSDDGELAAVPLILILQFMTDMGG